MFHIHFYDNDTKARLPYLSVKLKFAQNEVIASTDAQGIIAIPDSWPDKHLLSVTLTESQHVYFIGRTLPPIMTLCVERPDKGYFHKQARLSEQRQQAQEDQFLHNAMQQMSLLAAMVTPSWQSSLPARSTMPELSPIEKEATLAMETEEKSDRPQHDFF